MISRMFKLTRFFLVAFIGTLAAGAASQETPSKSAPSKSTASKAPEASKTPDAPDAAKADASAGDYMLQPQDLLRVQVFQEDDINRLGEQRVSQDFTIRLPMIGTVDLKGKTKGQAQEIIRELYDRDYLVNPGVIVFVLEYAPRNVFVSGSVGAQGVVPFPREQGLTLIDAILKAGGFTRLADKKHVTLKRTNADGTSNTVEINAEELMKGTTTATWPLQPNDVITVPERIL
jgi:protein involved in polysaccharide export with SLBB domain